MSAQLWILLSDYIENSRNISTKKNWKKAKVLVFTILSNHDKKQYYRGNKAHKIGLNDLCLVKSNAQKCVKICQQESYLTEIY